MSLKVLPGVPDPDGGLRPGTADGVRLFAHLKLRADSDPVGPEALTRSSILEALPCSDNGPTASRPALILAQLGVAPTANGRC